MKNERFTSPHRPAVNDPALCIVHSRDRQMVPSELAKLLDPVDPATFHEYVLPPNTRVELHYHDFDEYWWFTSGSPIVTLWTEAGGAVEFQLSPDDLVACVRGVAHTLRANEPLVYFQYCSFHRPGARDGHLTDGVPRLAES